MSEVQCNIKKNEIRQIMKCKRLMQNESFARLSSEKICRHLFSLDEFTKAENVCVYMSAFGEVDTSDIIDKCKELGKNVSVPVVNGDDISLSLLSDRFKIGAYGIKEPLNYKYFDSKDVDAFIVPGLAFDKCGGRIGFGKGYYDKLLSNVKACKVGILYDFQLVDNAYSYGYDIKMNYIITENKVINCG